MPFHIQELFVDYKSDDEAPARFYEHGWSDVWIRGRGGSRGGGDWIDHPP